MAAQRIAVAVVLHDGCLLVGRRPPGKPLAGFHEFPGGKVREDETLSAAAVRECREETGVPVQVMAEILRNDHHYPHGRLTLHFFHCRPLELPPEGPAPPFQWVPRDQAIQLEFPPANRAVLQWLAAH